MCIFYRTQMNSRLFLLIHFFICVYGICWCMYVFVYMAVPVHVPVEARGWYWMSSSVTLHLLRMCLSLNLNSMLGLTGWGASPWGPPGSPSQHWDDRNALPFPACYVALIRWYLLWLLASKVSLCAVLAASLGPGVHGEATLLIWWHLRQHQRERGWGSRHSILGPTSMILLPSARPWFQKVLLPPYQCHPPDKVFKAWVFGDILKYSNK